MKSGIFSLVGRPYVGKSTLLNNKLGMKIAITSNVAGTTRNIIQGIYNDDDSQIIFIDTPGIHKPKSKLGDVMVETAFGASSDVDIVLFVVDATSEAIGKGDRLILDKIIDSKKKCILVINKVDLVAKEQIAKLIELYSKEYSFTAVVPVSVIKNKNLDILLDEIENNLKVGPAYYNVEEYTDQTLRQLAEETIREKTLRLLDQEVPHGIYIEVEKMKFRKTVEKQSICDISATIYCLKKSHKGIIIGKDGKMLKRIGTYAREDLERTLDTKVNLQLWVKVREDWINDSNLVKKFKLQ